MRIFTDTELARFQAAQEIAMQDTCYLLRRTTHGPDEWGQEKFTWERTTPAAPLACGVDPGGPREAHGSGEVGLLDVALRLPLATDVAVTDRVELLTRYAVALDPSALYEIVGPVERGPSGLVLKLRVLTTGE